MTPATPPAVAPPTPVRSLPDVWAAPSRGIPWCDCGDDDPLTESMVRWFAESLSVDLPDRLTHAQVLVIAAEVWQLENVCRFFTLGVEVAAREVYGQTCAAYPTPVGLAIVKAFSDAWNGCPERACASA